MTPDIITENFIRQFLISSSNGKISQEAIENTPHRFLSAINYLLSGYKKSPDEILSKSFENTNNIDYFSPIEINNIAFISICEHHCLPIKGVCNITYIPNKKIAGLSKIPRVVDLISKRFQLQERMTKDIAEAIFRNLEPKYVKVEIIASHDCVGIRGIEKPSTMVKTIYEFGTQ